MNLIFEINKKWKYGIVAILGSLTLLGCSTPPAAAESKYSLTLKINSGDSQAVIEQRYGGKAILWDAQAGVAVLSVNRRPLGQVGAQEVTLETNTKVFYAGGEFAQQGTSQFWAGGTSQFWAGGTSQFWAGGTSQFWAGGTSQFWAGGVFAPMAQNTSPWQQINLEQAQSMARNLGYGVKVAVIDTGIDLRHPAFQGSLDQANAWDFVDNDSFPQEDGQLGVGAFGHGTNVAGIIRQIAPRATILPIRVLDREGKGYVSDIVAAINLAVTKGANVINLSLGSKQLSWSVEAAIWSAVSKGILVVSSSGNTGDTNITYPATLARLSPARISVASVSTSNIKSIFSTYGSAIEVAAPGEMIYAPAPDNRLMAWSGTSMSAAVVSGGAALALGEPIKVSKFELLRILWSNATDINNVPANQIYKDLLGGGTLDLERFLKHVL